MRAARPAKATNTTAYIMYLIKKREEERERERERGRDVSQND